MFFTRPWKTFKKINNNTSMSPDQVVRGHNLSCSHRTSLLCCFLCYALYVQVFTTLILKALISRYRSDISNVPLHCWEGSLQTLGLRFSAFYNLCPYKLNKCFFKAIMIKKTQEFMSWSSVEFRPQLSLYVRLDLLVLTRPENVLINLLCPQNFVVCIWVCIWVRLMFLEDMIYTVAVSWGET